MRALGAELAALGEVTGTRVRADVALLFDWHNWWALELEARPSGRMRYLDAVRDWYEAPWTSNITCDVVPPGTDLAPYKAVVAPNLYLLADEHADDLSRYVHRGGHLAVGCFSGVVDSCDRVRPGGHPGALRDVLGLRVDEYLPLRPEETVRLSDGSQARQWAERVEPRGCDPVLRFAGAPDGGPARGGPAATRHTHGEGMAWYVATRASVATLRGLIRDLGEEAGLRPAAAVPEGVEAVRRTGPEGSYLFLANHTGHGVEAAVEGTALPDAAGGGSRVEIPAGGVVVVREEKRAHRP
ncbi:beta-galactosidase [Streptomyces sp. KL2]|uniref:beta-galactosidase n=1 Tax=Streptomyces sp. KL2 TaxID=3050126 RepID=UPI00397DD287